MRDRKTKTVKVGNLGIGGKNPVRIMGMLKKSLKAGASLLQEAKRLEAEGAETIRVAVKEPKDASIVNHLKKHIKVPLVADIHFHHKLAIRAIEAGFNGIRLNPLNIYKKEEIRDIARQAKKAKISIRVGINSGGFKKDFGDEAKLAERMADESVSFIKILEKEGFFDIIVSLKSSSAYATILANRIFSRRLNYPLQLGVTATGPFLEAVIKSCIGIGALLAEGIGDAIRVSLTAPSFWEIRAAKYILQSLDLRSFHPQIISCPTCSRCEVDLIKIVEGFKKEMAKMESRGIAFPNKIAIMGCEVNGPGEAYQADIGIAFGKKRGVLFKKNKILSTVAADESVKDMIEKIGGCHGTKRG